MQRLTYRVGIFGTGSSVTKATLGPSGEFLSERCPACSKALTTKRVETSVIVVTHNSAADIVPCLQEIFRQGPHEVVVVDNGSTDGTAELVRSRFPQAKVIEQANKGFGGGNNAGAAVATGDVLLFVNPDTLPEPGFVTALANAVAPSRAATAQVVLKSNPGRLNTFGHVTHLAGFGFTAGLSEPRLRLGNPVEVRALSGAAFAIQRDDFQRIGGFDEDFFLYMEDTEISWRLHRAGVRIVGAPAAVVQHDYRLDVGAWKLAHLEAGRLLLLRKHLPWFLWVGYAPSLVVAEGLAWGKALALGWPGVSAKWRATRQGLRRGLRKYPHLPRARPHLFCEQAIPFRLLSRSRGVRFFGALANGVFRLNTATWYLRRRASRSAR